MMYSDPNGHGEWEFTRCKVVCQSKCKDSSWDRLQACQNDMYLIMAKSSGPMAKKLIELFKPFVEDSLQSMDIGEMTIANGLLNGALKNVDSGLDRLKEITERKIIAMEAGDDTKLVEVLREEIEYYSNLSRPFIHYNETVKRYKKEMEWEENYAETNQSMVSTEDDDWGSED